jgi:hypothetical protein
VRCLCVWTLPIEALTFKGEYPSSEWSKNHLISTCCTHSRIHQSILLPAPFSLSAQKREFLRPTKNKSIDPKFIRPNGNNGHNCKWPIHSLSPLSTNARARHMTVGHSLRTKRLSATNLQPSSRLSQASFAQQYWFH